MKENGRSPGSGPDWAGDEAVDVREQSEGLPSTRPALRAVQFDQADVVGQPLNGFASTVGIIRWLQEAAVVTLGELEDSLYPDLVVRDETLKQALLDREARARWFHEPIGDRRAQELREDLVATHIEPACIRAHTTLADKAGEYSERDVYAEDYNPGDLDPAKQKHTAMRPGYDEIDRDQKQALARFWAGFDDREDLLAWLRRLKDPTESQIPEDFPTEVLHDQAAVEILVDRPADDLDAVLYRDWFLGARVLPFFAAGVRELSPGEVIHADTGGVKPYGN